MYVVHGHQYIVYYILHLHDWIMMTAKYPHEASYIGGGCPPIETKDGWLLIYHGVQDTIHGYVYSACAALFDLNNPLIEIGRLKIPLFYPEEEYEKTGFVNTGIKDSSALKKLFEIEKIVRAEKYKENNIIVIP